MRVFAIGLGAIFVVGALVLERTLAKTPGIARVYVNPATEMAYCHNIEHEDPAMMRNYHAEV
jgi:FtsP/CotA-like multicopper oxidase with cupredoxin domain